MPYIRQLSYKHCGKSRTPALPRGLLYTDKWTSLVQNTDTEKQLQTVSFDPLITPRRNFVVPQDGVSLFINLANPTSSCSA